MASGVMTVGSTCIAMWVTSLTRYDKTRLAAFDRHLLSSFPTSLLRYLPPNTAAPCTRERVSVCTRFIGCRVVPVQIITLLRPLLLSPIAFSY